jgi:hypothetical protein
MNTNTTNSQDEQIRAAVNSSHIANLVEIINDLDSQIDDLNLRITRWKEASGCSDPEDLKLRKQVKLNQELVDLRRRVGIYEDILNQLANWPDGDDFSGMDEPGAAQAARSALNEARNESTSND